MRPGETITSIQNPRVRSALALRDARERRRSGHLLVDGAREIGRALGAGLEAEECFVALDRIRSDEARATLAEVERRGVPVVPVSPSVLARIAFGERDEGLVLVAKAPSTSLERLQLPPVPLVAVVDSIEKPGNLGAIARSADGAGVDALIVADPLADPWNPNAIRASVGTILALPLAVCWAGDARHFLERAGIRIVATRVDGAIPYTEADLSGPVAIVMGGEAEGLSTSWDDLDVVGVRIPMRGIADSLNVSVSAAILFYEALRQRGAAKGRG